MKDFLEKNGPSQENALRRFSYVPYDEPLTSTVGCSYEGCNFEAKLVEEMVQHLSTTKHPGFLPPEPATKSWVCGKCHKTYEKWNILYVHLATHSLPYSCEHCAYKTSRLFRLKQHAQKEHGHVIEQPDHWSLQGKGACGN